MLTQCGSPSSSVAKYECWTITKLSESHWRHTFNGYETEVGGRRVYSSPMMDLPMIGSMTYLLRVPSAPPVSPAK